MPSPILATGAGAAGGLETLLARARAEELLRIQQKQETETERRNRASEGLQQQQLTQNDQFRRDTLAATVANRNQLQDDRQTDNARQTVQLRPIGATVDPAEKANEIDRGAATQGNYLFKPANMGMSIPDKGEIGPTDSSLTWQGTQSQQVAQQNADKERAAPAATSNEVKTVVLDGKPVDANYDPKTQRWSYRGQDITDKIGHYTPPDNALVSTQGGILPRPDVAAAARAGDPMQPPDSPAMRDRGARKVEAQTTLDKLDADIDAAGPMIGPAMGRLSDLEQHIGDADPHIMRLATRFLAAKMQVDAGIGGIRGAASPQLLARWDNLLGNKVTPEGLHQVVQVMREMVGGQAQTQTTPADSLQVGGTFQGKRITKITKRVKP